MDFTHEASDLYEETTFSHKYWVSFYHSVLLLTGNDILPKGVVQICFVSIAVTMGAILNANIFGNVALIISDMNKKTSEFQD
jgi:hypothetical protein